ncbi:NAD-dependent epimerase/dehydratase [Tolypothrix sp. NIES-4075]|uniref:NAD-dependent epimerase/dehydratase family protein n=1 Tax=Tolypothrix sp. NIES-4075 TaxID=2005459 RepID=UPI000B5CD245|nr:NAD(P)-dependent oxidoreductase [Tolypothrix sp. NIES-4075]GAX40652.1 NAD-dependent epimerase/dehydratase [Tolypothrix sp. NIES-4075]
MKLLITGASGFLGQYVVAQALRQKFEVRAVVRPSSDEKRLSWYNHPQVELARIDLQQSNIVEALDNVNGVIHLAATKQGNFETQYNSTVVGTENLLKAMVSAQVRRLVAISSFSVFDYLYIASGEIISEDSPIEREPKQRDVYAQTKLIQENLVRDFSEKHNIDVTIIRPGVVYGRDNLWNASLGVKVSDRLWIQIGKNAQIPLTYVENCAEAIVTAVNSQEAIGKTLNIVDDDLPTQSIYFEKLIELQKRSPFTIGINWTMMRSLARTSWVFNKLLKDKVKLPGILIPARLHARFKPLRYSNTRAQQVLNWKPKYSLDAALKRSCSDIELLNM